MSITSTPIAVLFGGPSPEAPVSEKSAAAVCAALERLQQPYQKINLSDPSWISHLLALKPSFAFLALHGAPGEDGTVQGLLDLMGVAYNGSGVLASALAMDKPRAKLMLAENGLQVAPERVLPAAMPAAEAATYLADFVPCVLKPSCGGSSLGVEIVHDKAQLSAAFSRVAKASAPHAVLAEKFIAGKEFTVAVMAGKAVEITEIAPAANHTFYDYDAKYTKGGSVHVCPAQIAPDLRSKLMRQAERAHAALGCKGISRSDFRVEESSGTVYILEVNTLPGLTETSLVPEQAAATGMDFTELVKWMVEDGLCNKANNA